MRDLQALLKEYEFYRDIDKKLRSNVLVKGWYKSLSKEEKELLKNEMQRLVNQISESIEIDFKAVGHNIFKGMALGIKDESRPNL